MTGLTHSAYSNLQKTVVQIKAGRNDLDTTTSKIINSEKFRGFGNALDDAISIAFTGTATPAEATLFDAGEISWLGGTITASPTPTPITTPTAVPISAPTSSPTATPTTEAPTGIPTEGTPTNAPTTVPITEGPTTIPTTAGPTANPTSAPTTRVPTSAPTETPTYTPTNFPTSTPTTTGPTRVPVSAPTTHTPSLAPTTAPTTHTPTNTRTATPIIHTSTADPTVAPITNNPTYGPAITWLALSAALACCAYKYGEYTHRPHQPLYYKGPLEFDRIINKHKVITNNIISKDISPIGIALNADKIDLVSLLDSSISFDYIGNGNKTKTSWIGPKDAFLIYDHNDNKQVDAAHELVLTVWSKTATTDFEALKEAFDSNANNKFDIEDDKYKQFMIWQDKNQDGISQNDELSSLLEAGLLQIDFNTEQTTHGEFFGIQQDMNIAKVLWIGYEQTLAYDLTLETTSGS